MFAATFFSGLDWAVLIAYFIGISAIGVVFYRRNRSADDFTAGGRSLPGWLCGMSIFATYLSSISYLALPGKAFVDNWNAFAFSLALPPAAWIAVRYFLPMYRASGEVSAYSLLERRFGLWARLFASSFYLLFQIARIGVVMYLMALPMAVLFGWDIRTLIVLTGVIVTVYSFIGGITAVIWADAIQAFVLLAGALLALAILLAGMPDGPGQVFETAASNHKFSLGSTSPWILSQPTLWVVLAYGLFENIKNFGVDQSYVQRYIASSSDREAAKSIWLGALLYVPVSALFLFIGTALFAYYESHPADMQQVREVVATQKLMQAGVSPDSAGYQSQLQQTAAGLTEVDMGDRVFPHFIAAHLPVGVRGLLIAAVFAAAMSTVSTSLNSSATLVMSDFYSRLFRPDSSDHSRVRVLRGATVVWGLLGTIMALILVRLTNSVLDIWWTLSGVLGAAIIGLFLLGITSPRLRSRPAIVILGLGVTLIAWMTFSQTDFWPEELASYASPFHAFLVIVLGPMMMVVLGLLAPPQAKRQSIATVLLITLTLGCCDSVVSADDTAVDKRPNVVMIVTDDQAPWAWGKAVNRGQYSDVPAAHTPNLDRLASQGVTFDQFYCTTPVCSPARAAMMTGRYASEFGILDFIPQPGHKLYDPEHPVALDPQRSTTFANVLQRDGYATGLVGKWHLGDWSASGNLDQHPTQFGFDSFMGLTGGGTSPQNPELEEHGELKKFAGLTTDILTDRAIGFIRSHAQNQAQKPFLLCLHTRAPHGAWLPVAPEDWQPYENMDPAIPSYPDLDTKSIKRKMREYLASVSGVDRNLGLILDQLDQLKLTDNTVVIFTSDHGYNMGHNGIWHKGNGIWATKTRPPGKTHQGTRVISDKYRPNLYDLSLRVPAIVRWPGVIDPGSTIQATASSLDWFPTLLEIAGAEPPADKVMRGSSLVPLFRGDPAAQRSPDLYAEYSMINYAVASLRCYRTPEFKLIRDFHNQGRDEFYDLRNDPAESNNLIDDPRPEIQSAIISLDQKLTARMTELSDSLLDPIKVNSK
ncbi:sodium/solute symporter [Stieleria sp. TO1_6]|uniref:sodium:solute symporter family transporter n=1 Tax=Stieleria tagensis TaxID=2956795 RepID=UPI00209B2265|nr:sodium/solute symporter [Stieleria tagensis]MCO8124002.1 sodium/solute symporter [Stieleria tagensis]